MIARILAELGCDVATLAEACERLALMGADRTDF